MPSRTKNSASRKSVPQRGENRLESATSGKPIGRQYTRLSAGEWFEKLVAVQKRLRAPKGCPWDREQTHATLRPYLIEEAYEVLDALDSGDDAKFAEEMGDLLLQVVFHSEIAREQGRFAVADVVHAIHDKMVRRHPHVFGKVRAKDSAQVLRNWERIKAEERQSKERSSNDGKRKTGDAAANTAGKARLASSTAFRADCPPCCKACNSRAKPRAPDSTGTTPTASSKNCARKWPRCATR